MRAISPAEHSKLRQRIQNVKADSPAGDENLSELDTELDALFHNYQQLLQHIRVVLMEYNSRKITIRRNMKKVLLRKLAKPVKSYHL